MISDGPLRGATPLAAEVLDCAIGFPSVSIRVAVADLVGGLSARLAASPRAGGEPAMLADVFVSYLTTLGYPLDDWESGEVLVFPRLAIEILTEPRPTHERVFTTAKAPENP